MFINDIENLIRCRRSHRSFTNDPIADQLVDQICGIASQVTAPFGNKIHINPVRMNGDISKELKELGAYGVIRGATVFFAGSAPVTTEGLVDFGYIFEHAILKATDLELGTCWVGGSLNRSSFAERVKLQEGNSIICVSPVGYSSEKLPFKDRLVRFVAGSAKRKQWNELFFKENFGEALEEQNCGSYQNPLEMLRLSPSASNKQPWRVVMVSKSNSFHFFINRSPFYQMIMKKMNLPDLQLVDMGICMSHFHLSAVKHGLAGKWIKTNIQSIEPPKNTEYVASWNYK